MTGRILRSTLAALAMLGSLAGQAAAGPVLLYDTEGDRVLYAEDADQPWYAASLTKMMTAYLVFDAWKSGRIAKDAKITISAEANAQPKMRLGLGKGKELSFEDAVKALIIVSANDIAYAIAEGVSGTEDAFVAEMNAKAVKLGMTGTRFINPHGLPGEGQHTTAQDMARLAAALMRDHPDHLGYFGITMTEIGMAKKRMIATHNPVLITFDGGDGFKTGFTCSAGYNIVASATRDGRRLVVVVLGEESSAKRAVKTNALLEYGFKILAWKALFPAATIHSLPAGFYDRGEVRTANLTKRYYDCRAPEPPADPATQIAATDPKGGQPPLTATAAVAAAGTDTKKPDGNVKTGSVAAAPAPGKAAAKPVVASAAGGPSTATAKPKVAVQVNVKRKPPAKKKTREPERSPFAFASP
ncbi:MAG: D-alanyl-D-alanine carboxypeptidase family protein [Hyphomicrobium sp.]